MSEVQIFYRDLAYVFTAAVLGGVMARMLRQPTILGYVVAGILIGPFTPGPTVSDVHALEVTAEFGVILLMYSIGIEFSLRDLFTVRWVAVLGGPVGILLCIAMGILAAPLLGSSLAQGAALGAIVSVASTMVLSRLLIDRGELKTQHGKIMIGITLVEDVAVVVLTILLPAFSVLTGERFLSLGMLLGKAALILVPVLFLAAKLVPPLMARVARTGSQELFVLVAVALGFATAALTQAVGLSLALGAFLAGMVVSGSEVAHQTLSQLLPLRDVFVAVFFVTVGALINPRVLLSEPWLLGVIVLMIVAGKFLIWTAIVWLFRYPLSTALMVAVGLTQIGEFSFVLLQVARNSRLVSDAVYNATLTASLVSILLNAFLMKFASRWFTERRAVPAKAGRPERP
ncbi:MAG: ybaL [Candidatus Angelobacter sp.]|jgi:CPA2 family monovalent cation:H+ antiporter-2|nr:ybaL [Candidatus Angelobacter sp.]